MIPSMNIIAWANIAPWAEQRQIEQDLIISRVLIELFSVYAVSAYGTDIDLV